MKRAIYLAMFFAVIFGFHGLGAYAEETVINQDGKPVLLMDDYTWKIVDTSGDDGKVVFTITKAVDRIEVLAVEDDMEEFSHWEVYAGCVYTLTAHNNTDFKVKVNSFYLGSTQTDIFEPGYGNYVLVNWREVIEPRKSYSNSGEYGIADIWTQVEGEPKEQPTQERKEELSAKYGCKSQSGSIYLEMHQNWSEYAGEKHVVFSKEAKIIDNALKLFVKGSPNGIYPLREKIEF